MSNSPEKKYTGDSLLYNENTENNIELFDDETKEYKESRERELPDFLEFHSSFPRTGKQGVLGLLSNTENGQKYVYKISQYLNFMADQEYSVMKGLNSIRDYCPHFCKTYGKFKVNVIDSFRNVDNPFSYEKEDNHIQTDVLLMENIENGRKLYRYIKNDNIRPEIILSLVKQTIIANIIAGDSLKFTHYDMHSNNVLVKKCPANSAFFYILDENRTYLTPTYGYFPIIIDFGFSFNKNCENKPFYGALAHTDIGFMPSVYDQHSDAKLFLTSVSYEMKKYKKSEISTQFRRLISSIYKKCDIDLECGWDVREGPSVSDQLLKKMSSQFKRSAFFKEQGHHVVDILQSLVDLPLVTRHTNDSIDDLVGILVTEFLKIEKEIKNDFYNMYILKTIIESCVRHKERYLDKETRMEAVASFKKDILDCVDSLVNFCNPKINWEKLICCLLCLSKCIENYCHDKMKKLMSLKKSDYNNMPLRSPTEIYEAIEANIPSHFFYDEKTDIYVWNCVEKNSYKTKLPKIMIDKLNETHPFERGMILYEYLSGK
jgi:hypothetical protein